MAIVYQHRRNDTNEIFYIGIGKIEKRATSLKNRNKHWHNIVNKVGFEAEIILKDLTWEEAKETEIYLIKFYGRKDLNTGKLVNMTDGGDGTFGIIPWNKGLPKELNPLTGIKRPDQSIRMKDVKHPTFNFNDRQHSEDSKNKIRLANIDKEVSDDTRKKMSISAKNKPEVTDEFRTKMSVITSGENNGMFGKKQSEEAKAKMRATKLLNKLNKNK